MSDLIDNQNLEEKIKFTATGPVFEFGPGWSAVTKDWLKKYSFKIVLPVVILALIVVTAISFSKNSGKLADENNLEPSTLQQTVVKGDSYAKVARRAIADYLAQNPDQSFSAGQRLFAEETLRRSIKTQQLLAGLVIEFDLTNVKTVLAQSRLLSTTQLQKWQEYAKKAGL